MVGLLPGPAGAPREEQGTTLAAAFARAVAVDPSRVAEAAASLHRPVHDEDGLADLLNRAVAAAVRWLPDVDFAGITVQLGRDPVTAASTDPVVLAVDELQLELGDGPCLTAMRTGQIVSADAITAVGRWPELAARARPHGVASFLASPLVVEGAGRGSINLYSRLAGGFDGTEADLLAVLSSYVSRGLADFAVLRSAQVQVEQMRQAMAGRAPIEQAKGILMAVHQITADAAFELLRIQSQNTNTKLHDVAAAFVAAQTRQPLGPHAETPAVGPAATGSPDFQSAFDHAPVGLAIADVQVTLLIVNAALARLLGATPSSLSGTSLFDVVHPADRVDAEAACAELREGAEVSSAIGVRLREAGGGWIPVTVSTTKVLAADGSPAHLVVSVVDLRSSDALRGDQRVQRG
ncbi:MAG: ANTAR domain-containing protein [Mycobacteriaceae bacterium]